MLIVFVIRSYPNRGHCLNNFVTAHLRVLAQIVLFAQIESLLAGYQLHVLKPGTRETPESSNGQNKQKE